MFIVNAKGDNRQYLIQNGGGTYITSDKLSVQLRNNGTPWIRDADPEWVRSVIAGGSRVAQS